MNTVTRSVFFRMSFILQDSSATTTSTYLAKIIESELFVANSYLSIEELSERISDNFALEFSELEIINVIRRDKNIIQDSARKYALTPKRMGILAKTHTIDDQLTTLVKRFISEKSIEDFDVQTFTELFSRFLYHCFNTNKDSLLLLLGDDARDIERIHFEASKAESNIINEFLNWNNAEKDKLIYQVISTCYAYCSLTVKKDTVLSESIFRNKKFYLDTNIIFRLAGLNKAERQRTLTGFVSNCQKLKIKLLYTDATFTEINRVINNKCVWLKRVNDGEIPIDLSSFEHREDDFYELYRRWCHDSSNCCGDFNSFAAYLHRLVDDILAELNKVSIPNYRLRNPEDFNANCRILAEYKKSNCTQPSLDTDINNLYHIIHERKGEDTGSLFSTSTYMISADQNLIAFANEYCNGIQTVVLPSVWLTIMLRFAGRTEDDYKSFVLFMSIRNESTPHWDVYKLLEKLSLQTNDEEIKRKVITEIQSHHDMYPVSEEDCDAMVQKAFDSLLLEERLKSEEKLNEQKTIQEAMTEKYEKDQNEAINKALEESARKERERNATKLATKKVDSQLAFWRIVSSIFTYLSIGCIVFAMVSFFGWLLGIVQIESFVEKIIPQKLKDNIDGQINLLWSILGSGLFAILKYSKKSIESKYSNERRKNLIAKETVRKLRIMEED